MTVYVDDMLRPARPVGYRGPGTPRWSHLMADTTEELLAMADRLGLRPDWIQHPGTVREHFDVTAAVRSRAIAAGAVAVTYPWGTSRVLAKRRELLTQQVTDNASYPTPTKEKP